MVALLILFALSLASWENILLPDLMTTKKTSIENHPHHGKRYFGGIDEERKIIQG